MPFGKFESAIDEDGTPEKRSICYRVEDGESLYFVADPRVPVLYVKKSLDREAQPSYNVTVRTHDCHWKERDIGCNDPSHKAVDALKVIEIRVSDVNDNFPKFLRKEYFGKVMERRTQFDEVILRTVAVDPDEETAGLRYALASVVRTEKEVCARVLA